MTVLEKASSNLTDQPTNGAADRRTNRPTDREKTEEF
jgi:hypothetical protein